MEFKNIEPHEPMVHTQFHAFIESVKHRPKAKYFYETLNYYLKACNHTEALTDTQITAHKYTHNNYWEWYAKQQERAVSLQIEENVAPIIEELLSAARAKGAR